MYAIDYRLALLAVALIVVCAVALWYFKAHA